MLVSLFVCRFVDFKLGHTLFLERHSHITLLQLNCFVYFVSKTRYFACMHTFISFLNSVFSPCCVCMPFAIHRWPAFLDKESRKSKMLLFFFALNSHYGSRFSRSHIKTQFLSIFHFRHIFFCTQSLARSFIRAPFIGQVLENECEFYKNFFFFSFRVHSRRMNVVLFHHHYYICINSCCFCSPSWIWMCALFHWYDVRKNYERQEEKQFHILTVRNSFLSFFLHVSEQPCGHVQLLV